jgi:glycosidase
MTLDEAQAMIDNGVVGGGMLPKLQNCIDAMKNGVSRVHILDGRLEHCLLLEFYTEKGIGTAMVKDDDLYNSLILKQVTILEAGTNKEVQTHLINSTQKFLKYGIDAVRIDHCIGPDLPSLKNIITTIHKSYPTVPFIGEILPIGISDHSETILGITEKDLKNLDKVDLTSLKYLDEVVLKYVGCLDGALDFAFQYYVDMFVKGEIDEAKCNEEIIAHFKRYGKDFILLKNIDSHDSDRIMFRCKNNFNLFQKAMKLLYKNWEERNDPVVVYYGTEDFMNQEKTIYGEPYGDFRCRQPMYFTNAWINQFFKDN